MILLQTGSVPESVFLAISQGIVQTSTRVLWGLSHSAGQERVLCDSAPSRVIYPIPPMTTTEQPTGAASSSRYRWTAMPTEQPRLGYQSLVL